MAAAVNAGAIVLFVLLVDSARIAVFTPVAARLPRDRRLAVLVATAFCALSQTAPITADGMINVHAGGLPMIVAGLVGGWPAILAGSMVGGFVAFSAGFDALLVTIGLLLYGAAGTVVRPQPSILAGYLLATAAAVAATLALVGAYAVLFDASSAALLTFGLIMLAVPVVGLAAVAGVERKAASGAPDEADLAGAGQDRPATHNVAKLRVQADLGDRYAAVQSDEDQAATHAMLAEALEKLQDGVILFDASDRIVFLNQTDLKLDRKDAGIRVGDTFREFCELVGKSCVDAGHCTPREADQYVHMRMELHARRPFTEALFRPDGRVFRITEAQTTSGGTILLYTEITNDWKSRLELIRARERAEAANTTKSRFLANMSHELRTPLNAVIGFSSMLDSDMSLSLSDDKRREYAGNILESGQHLLSIIDDLLDLSRIDTGALSLELQSVTLAEIVEAAARMVDDGAERIQLDSSVPGSDWQQSLVADRRAMVQIMVNLMSNALKFSAPEAPVTIRFERGAEGSVGIHVVDKGPGIPAHQLAEITQPFVQLDDPYARRRPGVGLGLAISRRLAEAHGGYLDIRSTEGEGTTAIVWIPHETAVDMSGYERAAAG